MFIVIYNKFSKKIIQIISQEDLQNGVIYGYSENCAEVLMDHKPEGKYLE